MKILIIEDEALMAEALKTALEQLDRGIEVLACLGAVGGAVEYLKYHPLPDLVFSDIQLSDGLSFEVFRRVNFDIPVIFCTAYDEYALEAFRQNGIDYLLKPFSREDLVTALEKYELLIATGGADELPSLGDSINVRLNEQATINHRRIYLLTRGTHQWHDTLQHWSLDVLANAYYFLTSEGEQLPFMTYSSPWNAAKWLEVWYLLSSKEKWEVDAAKWKKQAKIVEQTTYPERGWGLNWGIYSSNFTVGDVSTQNSFSGFGYQSYRRLNYHWIFNFHVDAAVKFPNPQQIIQEQVFSQVDFSSILNGDDIEVDIDATIGGHFMGGVGISFDRQFRATKGLRPFVGAGFRLQFATFFEADLDTTIVIENTGDFSGFDGGDRSGFDRNGEDLVRNTFYYPSLYPKLGCYLDVSPHVVMDLHLQYLLDKASFESAVDHLNMMQLNVGLRYRFTGKKTSRYRYF